jgi:hypothetical protein
MNTSGRQHLSSCQIIGHCNDNISSRVTVTMYNDCNSGESFRETLLHLLPHKTNTDPITLDDESKISIPINVDDSADGGIDVYIAKGRFPTLSQGNEDLRNRSRLLLLTNPDEETVPNNEIDIRKTNCNIEQQSLQSSRILYVAQGELAHCTPVQADLLVSDRATTCHILGLRSSFVSTTEATTHEILCTLAHLDSTMYTECIRDAFQSHYDYHYQRYSRNFKSKSIEPWIELDIHIVGGFKDDARTSGPMSVWAINLLADMADQYYLRSPRMKMILRTACITAANHDNTSGGPVVRGMAFDCRTGKIYSAHCVHPCPAITLRMAKVWVRGHSSKNCDAISLSKLSVIYTHLANSISIESLFPNGRLCCFCGFLQHDMRQQFDQLLQIRSYKLLLKYCSTSPEHEEEDFCTSTRTSFQYILKEWNTANVNESLMTTHSKFQRKTESINVWIPLTSET